MPRPTKPSLTVMAVEIICPACEECIPSPYMGSLFWSFEDLSMYKEDTVTCSCGKRLVFPKFAAGAELKFPKLAR